MTQRCPWCGSDPLYRQYHDEEWGVPLHDDQKLFEFITLEGFQAGLSWLTILKKRENFRSAFDNFDPQKVANYGQTDIERLMNNAGIIRNRKKIEAAVSNAQAFLAVQEAFGSFDAYMWGFMDGETPHINRFDSMTDVPAHTPLAQKISADLKKRGFKFVGPTVVYSHMQATGMVMDHLTDCFRHDELVQSLQG